MKTIRIYYESLEQAEHYIKPIVKKTVNNDFEIILCKRPKKNTELNDGAISAILTMVTPDVLITGTSYGKEYPLVLIEFSEAVSTEDHELQRTYGAVAAYLSGAYYLKLSGEKQSEKEFGGAKYNPYSTPKIFIDEVNYEGYVIAFWETQKDNQFTLKRDPRYPSCPPVIEILTATLQSAIRAFVKSDKDWFVKSLNELKKEESYKKYRANVDKADGAKELLNTWKNRRDTNLNKVRYFVKDKFVAAKINRFSHAMDPDRGILIFISSLFSQKMSVFGIYALVRPHGSYLVKKDMTSVDTMRKKLKIVLEMDRQGLPNWLIEELNKVIKSVKYLDEQINFQPIWEKYKNELLKNKVVMTLAYFLDGIYLNHNGVCIKWDKRALLNSNNGNFLEALSENFGFSNYTSPTNITEVVDEVDEDEITYSIVHKVLIPNGFKIVSVSYPGSQGGGAILPKPELGKAQPREYPDIIALPPKNSKIDVVLNESKGMFVQKAIEADLEKILRYKVVNKLKEALKETLFVAQVIDKNKELKNIVIGVSFGVKDNTQTTWKADKVDFIFRVINRKQWAIGIFKQSMKDLIGKIEGKTDFPKIYKLFKNGLL
ncbi:MAG: hypothetical protein LE180_05340 [Endomicrobium sp.]|uniref:hypothetical protein n=1 Tax=Candidatus Endomicrobiellum pyrsonymphae TaxID=1408203 RepID=UPI003583520B|nr:hypothetical protein [Endomicrobium sp.]